MKTYASQDIRNIAVVGHGDAGKTSLVSALLFVAGATERLGSVDQGTTVTDHDEDEIERKITIHTALAHVDWKGVKINLLDTPGFNAFVPDAKPAVQVAEASLFVVDAADGVLVQTEKVLEYANEFQRPRLVVINRLDRERANFPGALDSVKDAFGREAVPVQLPLRNQKEFTGVVDLIRQKAFVYQPDGSGKFEEREIPDHLKAEASSARETLIEMVAESDDALMERFFAEGTLSDDELVPGIKKAIAERKLYPVFVCSASLCIGADPLLEAIVQLAPAPPDLGAASGRLGIGAEAPEVQRPMSDDQPYSALVFKTIADPFAGRITLFKVYSGIMKSDMTAYNITRNVQERLGPIHIMQGKQMEKVAEVHAGDIAAVSKLKETVTGDTFTDKGQTIVYRLADYPCPAIAFAVQPRSRGDEDKLSTSIHKLLEEDQSLRFERDPQTKDFLLSGTGQLHIEVTVGRLKRRYGVEVDLKLPKVPYRETIRTRVEAQGRHKKQTGGRGQFGDCTCVFEPLPRDAGFEFVDKIFGGVIPQQFRPAVEKGIREAAENGPVAGYPLVDFRVDLIDGKTHDVDSDELSFKLAGRKSFRVAMEKAHPYLLEPIMNVEVVVPQEFAGDIMGDLNSRRGRIQGMDSRGNQQVIRAQVPSAEMLSYQSTLNSITAARGSYSMEFSHYDEVPTHIAQKIIDEARREGRIKAEEE
jgi:elongation factor G